MEKRIKSYRQYMDKLLEQLTRDAVQGVKETEQNATTAEQGIKVNAELTSEIERIKAEHLTQIAFFQHERLVHLIVTVVFAILEMLSLMLAVFSPEISTLLLTLVILILLVPYIRHYYILENEVQKMYGQYDKLCELSGSTKYFTFSSGKSIMSKV